jgi:hypothetical protein
MTRHDYKPRHAAAARLLGRHPEPCCEAETPERTKLYDLGWHDGCAASRRQLAARIEAAGLRGRMAVSLLEDGWAAVVLWALAGLALATLAALAGRLLGAG